MDLKLNQQATYWADAGSDEYGDRTFSSPALLNVRWEDRTDIVIMAQGEEISSKAVVFVSQAVDIGGYLALGNQTGSADPTDVEGAYIIRGYEALPDLDGEEFVRKAIL